MGILGKIFVFQPIDDRLERLHNTLLIYRVEDLTHSVAPFCDNAIRGKFINDFIVWIEADANFVRGDSHQDVLKTRISADIG